VSEQEFAGWVQPIAERLESSRQGVEQVVSQVPAESWSKPSGYPGWTYKDQLSHLGDSHARVQEMLRAVLEGRDPDFSQFLRIDEINEEDRRNNAGTPVEQLRTAFADRSDQTLSVIGELADEHGAIRLGPMTLENALQGFALHDTVHLKELKKALPT
jgi:uncharacterized protein (TIGR03083 family)